jgi:hypothetical protein
MRVAYFTECVAVSHRIAEQLRQLVIQCQKLAAESKDKDIANELESVGTELAEKARKLEELYMIVEAT